MFDVPAIQGGNAGRLIPKSPEDKLRAFFRSGRNISREARKKPRACARIKCLFNRRYTRIDVKFFSHRPVCRLFIHLPAMS